MINPLLLPAHPAYAEGIEGFLRYYGHERQHEIWSAEQDCPYHWLTQELEHDAWVLGFEDAAKAWERRPLSYASDWHDQAIRRSLGAA